MTSALPRTRLVAATSLGPRIYLKLETEMPTGSFKVRGALHALTVNLTRAGSPVREVIASSTGNHGAAVAWAAKRLGLKATIFLPRHPNPVKKANIVRLGAEVVEEGSDLAEAFDAATARAARSGGLFLNDATDPDVPNGAGTIADEIVEDCPDVEVIYVPVGDTALIRGVAARAKQLKPSVRIIGVQAETAPSYYLSWRDGVAVPTATAVTIADGLATRTPVGDNVMAIRALVDGMRLVSDAAMVAAVGRLLLGEHLVAEPSGAATVAALVGESPDARPENAVLLITGCNVTSEILKQAIESQARPRSERRKS